MTDPIQRAQPKFRRVVTGHDAEGKPIIWIDGEATNHKFPSDHISSTMMWSTNSSPTQIFDDEDEGARVLGTAPPAGGSRFTMMEFMPGNAVTGCIVLTQSITSSACRARLTCFSTNLGS